MMAQKPLHELLQEDQEPFLLRNYIADRRCQLKKPKPAAPRTNAHLLQIKKRKPISHNFCKNACLFSVTNSPDLKRSPLFELQSPIKSPCKSPNAIFLHIPAKTASLLLEAALRVQKQSSSSQKSKHNSGFGLFGSLMKRLTHRSNRSRKRELNGRHFNGAKTSVKDILKLDKESDGKQEQEIRFCRSSCSALWSESNNEEKSWDLDLDTSSSGQSEDEEEEMEFVNKLIEVNCMSDFSSYDNNNDNFCESPFHFVLKRSPSISSGHRTPAFLSPATSPCRHKTEGKENNDDVESLNKFQENEEEELEDKEQCSPVSVLDPPFEDDDDGHDDHSEDDGFDLECSYAIVQRTKKQLLQKLRRFEKLAELDPVELEKRMLNQENEYDDGSDDDDEIDLSNREQSIDMIVIEELSKSGFCRLRKIPKDMKRLVSDVINEEEKYYGNREATVKRVCKRFESWEEVKSNTIDMMVEEDFKKELEEWRRHKKQVGEAAMEIEFGIFGLLVEELSEELVDITGI